MTNIAPWLSAAIILLVLAALRHAFRRHRIGSRGVARYALWTGIAGLGVAALWFSWTIRAPFFMMFFVAVVYPMLRLWHDDTLKKRPHAEFSATGRFSVIKTSWLELHIDHDSELLTGRMLQGAMKDWMFSEMDGYDLMATRAEITAADPTGTALFDAWLDRHGPALWRYDFEPKPILTPNPPALDMTRAEALDVLGLDETRAAETTAAAARLRGIIGDHADQAYVRDLASKAEKTVSG